MNSSMLTPSIVQSPIRLNLGCGRSPLAGWINVDITPLPGVDIVADFEVEKLPFADSSVDEIFGSHVLEHVTNILPFMQELHRVAKPDARAVFRVPYGSSDDADEDPTHVRRYYYGSWGYYGQPYYWRADYGYRGDWNVEKVELAVPPEIAVAPFPEALRAVRERRNVVSEMVATLRAVKPVRPPKQELQQAVVLHFLATIAG